MPDKNDFDAYLIDQRAGLTHGRVFEDDEEATESCKDCDEAARLAYSDATTPGFFHLRCEKYRKGENAHE